MPKKGDHTLINYAEIGLRIRNLRGERGLNLSALAEKMGFSETYMSLIEMGKRPPDLIDLMKLRDILNTSLDYMVYGKTL
jgi:transcriptional regulator with XRE-family HTH domain